MEKFNLFNDHPERLFAESNLNLPDGMFVIEKQIGDFVSYVPGDALYDAITRNIETKPKKIVSFTGLVKHENGLKYPQVSFILNFEPFLSQIESMRKNGRMLEMNYFSKDGRSLTYKGVKALQTAKKAKVKA